MSMRNVSNRLFIISGLRLRFPAAVIVACALILTCYSQAHAGFLVGTNSDPQKGGNDTIEKVLVVIDQYNTDHDPDLIDPTELFKKTDDDKAFVFDMDNGFMFFEDADGNVPITLPNNVDNYDQAYFKYTGSDANILYYSVKGPSFFGFSLYTFMPGLNLLDLDGDGDDHDISHVSFWSGEPGDGGEPGVPEPSTLMLITMAFAMTAFARKRV
jgi:hypothetical protein